MSEPSVSPADTPTCDYCGSLAWTVDKYGRVTHKQGCPHRTDPWHQGDPAPVSPADTIRLDEIRERAEFAVSDEMVEMLYEAPEDAHRWVQYLGNDVLALLAVGERDKAELERALQGEAHWARQCERLGAPLDLPDGTLMDEAVARVESLVAERERDKAEIARLRRLVARAAVKREALLIAGERDRRQIAQLTEALEAFADPKHWAVTRDIGEPVPIWIGTYREHPSKVARAVLADKEDANG